MGERPSNTDWFPAPRQRMKPQQPLSTALIGWLFPVVAVAGGVAALALAFGSNHGTTRSPTNRNCTGSRSAACNSGPSRTPAQVTQAETARQAFQNCVKQAGGGGGGGFGRFGPSSKQRQAFEVCSTLLGHGAPNGPTQTGPIKTPAPPVA